MEVTMRYFEIIEKAGLGPWWAEFVQTNLSNRLPYHNLMHTTYMVEDCYEGALANGMIPSSTNSVFRALIMSAIFHDYGHVGGVFRKEQGAAYPPDSENIAIAILKVTELLKSGFWPAGVSLDRVIVNIQATEYPYVGATEDLNLSGRIIRDADLLTYARPTLVPHVLFGLSAEMGIPVKDLIPMGREFVNKATFGTDWGRLMWEARLPLILREMDAFAQTLDFDPPTRQPLEVTPQ